MSKYEVQTKDGSIFEFTNDSSISHAAMKNGVNLDYSCLTGKCGNCKALVKYGETQQVKTEFALTELQKADGYILNCCRVPKSNLKIDIENLIELEGTKMLVAPCKINQLIHLTEDVVQLDLRLPPKFKFSFLPGQFIELIQGADLKRSYSIANNPFDGLITLYIRKVSGGMMSDYLFNHAKPGDLLRIEGPKGTFFVRDKTADNYIFLATGTGIAPVVPMIKTMVEEKKVTRKIDLYWGGRQRKDFFLDLCALVSKYKNINLKFVSSRSRSSEFEYGYVQDIAQKYSEITAGTQVYACGSLAMINSSRERLTELGMNSDNFYSDAFVPVE